VIACGARGRVPKWESALPLVPAPHESVRCTAEPVTPGNVVAPAEASDVGRQLAAWLGRPEGSPITLEVTAPGSDPAIGPGAIDEEAYEISTRDAITIRAPTKRGLFWGAQTLAQLAGARLVGGGARRPEAIPCVTILDRPRHRVRAMHLDVARHFFDRTTVERYIDLLAFYRFNVFHWHLTDDQGFRFETKSHPELTRGQAFYTQDEMRAVVRYAAARGITVVPEIEMPGHARAILAAHPELSCTGEKLPIPTTWGIFDDVLCAGNEGSFALLDDVLSEVTAVFPSQWIHVGGDEVPHKRWSECPKCTALARERGVPIERLEGVFLERVRAMLAKRGRRIAVWDEAFDPRTLNDAVVFAWQSKERGLEAARAGRDVVMAPHQVTYFNIRQSHLPDEPGHEGHIPWTDVQAFDPGFSPHVVGGEGALWTEYVTTPEQIETMAMPRMAALAEALWYGPSASFGERFAAQLPMLDASNVRYFVEPPIVPRRTAFIDRARVTVKKPALFPFGEIRASATGEITNSTEVDAQLVLPSGRRSATVHASYVKESPRPATTLTGARPGATYVLAKGDFHRLPDLDRLATTSGRVDRIDDRALDLPPEHFAMRFDAYVEVPADGVYRFVARADDGVRVEVDGEPIAEDDGEHAPRPCEGEIALARGAHRLRVTWFQGTEGKELRLEMNGRPVEVVTEN
jgi:hexosaminidase